MSSKITIIHPTRHRTNIAFSVITKWLRSAVNPDNIEYILSVDTDDAHNYDTEAFMQLPIKVLVSENRSAIDAINNAAMAATGDIFIVVSDDFDCFERWDEKLLQLIDGRQDFCAKTKDGLQGWIITLPIMDRVYYERFGYIYYPEYLHMFCDTEMTHVAALLGRKIELDITFPHKHYSQPEGIEKDEISSKNDATWKQGEALYIERAKQQFGLTDTYSTDIPNHLRIWLKRNGVTT